MFPKKTQLGMCKGGLTPASFTLSLLLPEIHCCSYPVNACGGLVHSWKVWPQKWLQGSAIGGRDLQSLGSSSHSGDPRLPVSKAIWGYLKEADLEVT